MPLISPDFDAFLALCIAVAAPWAYYTYHSIRGAPARAAKLPKNTPQPTTTRVLWRLFPTIVAANSLYVAFNVIVNRPQNLFRLLHVPFVMPSDAMRAKLLALSDAPELPHHLESLLNRFNSFDMRLSYVRFGHEVFQECEHCHNMNDFALYALPVPGLQYTKMAILTAVMTVRDSGLASWRTPALALVGLAAAAEVYLTLALPIEVQPDGEGVAMIHDRIWLARQLLFFLLPVALLYAPAVPQGPSPLETLPATSQLFDQALGRVKLLRYSRTAMMKSDTLSSNAREWWDREREESRAAVNDPDVRRAAQHLGLGYQYEPVGPLRDNVQQTAEMLKAAYKP